MGDYDILVFAQASSFSTLYDFSNVVTISVICGDEVVSYADGDSSPKVFNYPLSSSTSDF